MSCKVCEDYLLEYLYGELDEENKALMDNHLGESSACRAIYQELLKVRGTAAGLHPGDPPEALHTRIMANAAEFQLQPPRRAGWSRMFRPVLTTAMVAIIASVVYFYTSPIQGPLEKKQIVLREAPFKEKEMFFSAERSMAPKNDSVMVAMNKGKAGKALQDESSVPTVIKPKEIKPRSKAALELRSSTAVTKDSLSAVKEDTAKEDFLYKRMKPMSAGPEKIKSTKILERDNRLASHAYSKSGPQALSLRRQGAEKSAGAKSIKEERGLISRTGPYLDAESVAPPPAISSVVTLAGRGLCQEAHLEMDACIAENPDKAVCGPGWLALARCFHKKGEHESARKMALKALKIPVYSKEAEAFLLSLPVTSK